VDFSTTVNLLGNILPLIVFYQACDEINMLRASYVSNGINTSVLRFTRKRIAAVDYKDENIANDIEAAAINIGTRQWSSCKGMLDSVTMRNAFSVHMLGCCCSEYWLFLIDAREYLKYDTNVDKLTQVNPQSVYLTVTASFN
jgi:hypothetical protein